MSELRYYNHIDPHNPPKGFRLLSEGELVKCDDLCCCTYQEHKLLWCRIGGDSNESPCFGKTVKENQERYPHVMGWATVYTFPPIFEGHRILSEEIITELVEKESQEINSWLCVEY